MKKEASFVDSKIRLDVEVADQSDVAGMVDEMEELGAKIVSIAGKKICGEMERKGSEFLKFLKDNPDWTQKPATDYDSSWKTPVVSSGPR